MILKAAFFTGVTSTTWLTLGQITPEQFNGWGIHLVLGLVAVASIWAMYKTAERGHTATEKHADALVTVSVSLEKLSKSQSEMASELGRSPCLLHRSQSMRGDENPPDIQRIIDEAKRNAGGHPR